LLIGHTSSLRLSNKPRPATVIEQEVGAGVFFRARTREAKKGAKARRKKSAKKAKAPSAKEKSKNSRFFLPPHWNPVPEARAARQVKKEGF
jgi:hypothetical protein